MRPITTLLALTLSTATAMAQNFNIDIDIAQAPADTFAGAAGQPGHWNNVTALPLSPIGLLRLDGWFSAVTIEADLLGDMTTFNQNSSEASGNFALLMEDGWRLTNMDQNDDAFIFTFSGLQAGAYFLYTYSDSPVSTEKDSRVGLGWFGVTDQQTVGGTHNTNQFVQNVTHTRHYVELDADEDLVVRIWGNNNLNNPHGVINGFQIRTLPRRLYVNAAAIGSADGLTWQNAFTDLRDALEAVPDYGEAIDEIWVAGGAYYPTDGLARLDAFYLINGVTICGGFAGTETELEQRDPQANPTMLSGNIGGPLPNDNSYHVFDTWNNDETAVLDGFTIMNGRADGPFGWDDQGGGMYIRDGSPTIRNCRFMLNYAEYGGSVNLHNSTATFLNCLFQNNTAEEEGGAIRYVNLPETGLLKISHCRFLSNQSWWEGAALDLQSGQAWISNCMFTGSFASNDGGAARVEGSGTTATFANCSLVGNYAHRFGGGICVSNDGHATVSNCILWDNTTSLLPPGSVLAQMNVNTGGTHTLSYSCLQGYNAATLPGSACTASNPQFVNADGGDGYGDLNDDLRLMPISPVIDAGNNFAFGNDGADIDGDGVTNEATPVDLAFNDRRVDNPSTIDTGFGGAPVIDMGAYEYTPGPILLGDMDCNGQVDLADIPAMALALTNPAQYVQTYGCLANGDFTQDTTVNGTDLQGFAGALLP